ncbi:hypothetical protein [Microbacterium thalassium]|uniref:CU044_5270 family protein n=1 Tax=Microbacterium thalassium TaxID=362649 RepID=A0A7X0FQD7_9MICO|nr:hypothetical protein [Microbacterium thalassium]MBB6391686.1 hypothetical protein [Microbacterium thalassium]GLK24289.1 hypothetical protein GCM10017607_16070 [Microbacterium thalassium]
MDEWGGVRELGADARVTDGQLRVARAALEREIDGAVPGAVTSGGAHRAQRGAGTPPRAPRRRRAPLIAGAVAVAAVAGLVVGAVELAQLSRGPEVVGATPSPALDTEQPLLEQVGEGQYLLIEYVTTEAYTGIIDPYFSPGPELAESYLWVREVAASYVPEASGPWTVADPQDDPEIVGEVGPHAPDLRERWGGRTPRTVVTTEPPAVDAAWIDALGDDPDAIAEAFADRLLPNEWALPYLEESAFEVQLALGILQDPAWFIAAPAQRATLLEAVQSLDGVSAVPSDADPAVIRVVGDSDPLSFEVDVDSASLLPVAGAVNDHEILLGGDEDAPETTWRVSVDVVDDVPDVTG